MPETLDLAQRLAALADLGFEPLEEVSFERDVTPVDDRRSRVVHSRPAMGTLVSVSVVCRSVIEADSIVGCAFEEMDRLIGIFSRFDSCTALSELNSSGRLELPPPELVQLAADAARYNALTAGGFDVSVGPLVELFRSCESKELPDAADVRAALDLVGAESIDISRRRIAFGRQGMRMTLDGIAKGFIVDRVARVLEQRGIRDYLVEAGGDIRVRGSRGDGRPWRVAVQDPDKAGKLPDVIEISSGAVATSGSYEGAYDPEAEHHHIFDRSDGSSPQYSSSVTVLAPTTQAADALATSVFLMSSDAGIRFIHGLPGCECLIIGRDGAQIRSRGWQSAAPLRTTRKVDA